MQIQLFLLCLLITSTFLHSTPSWGKSIPHVGHKGNGHQRKGEPGKGKQGMGKTPKIIVKLGRRKTLMKTWDEARKEAQKEQKKFRDLLRRRGETRVAVISSMAKARNALVSIKIRENKKKRARLLKLRKALADKKKRIQAQWAAMDSPADIFSKFPEAFMAKARSKYTPDELIQYIKSVLKKSALKKSLSRVEQIALKSTQAGLKRTLHTNNCQVFYSEVYYELAVCCRVTVSARDYGLCSPLRMVSLSMTEKENLLKAKLSPGAAETWDDKNIALESARWGYSRNRRSRSSWEEDAHDLQVMYIDLFAVPCYPAFNSGLCSQFCCSPGRRNGLFCDSFMDCY